MRKRPIFVTLLLFLSMIQEIPAMESDSEHELVSLEPELETAELGLKLSDAILVLNESKKKYFSFGAYAGASIAGFLSPFAFTELGVGLPILGCMPSKNPKEPDEVHNKGICIAGLTLDGLIIFSSIAAGIGTPLGMYIYDTRKTTSWNAKIDILIETFQRNFDQDKDRLLTVEEFTKMQPYIAIPKPCVEKYLIKLNFEQALTLVEAYCETDYRFSEYINSKIEEHIEQKRMFGLDRGSFEGETLESGT